MTSATATPRSPTRKFEQRRGTILDVASAHINAFGVRGMTLTGVASELGLDTSSVTYYFRKKEDLAVACLERSLTRQNEAARQAAAEPNAHAAMRTFLRIHLDICRADRPRDAPCLALLSDMNSMGEQRRAPLRASYVETVRILRGCFSGAASDPLVSVQALMGVTNWLPGWVSTYADSDFMRLEDRLIEILSNGIGNGARWRFDGQLAAEPEDNTASARFLRAATTLINENGYHGASVEKIAADLGVSTGSFYHHLNNKDDLVVACFERSFNVIDRSSAMSDRNGGSAGQRIATSLSSLVRLQVSAESPLLRSSAFQALPPHLRERMLQRTAQVTHHFAGVIADGIADCSILPSDPLIAAHVFVAFVNAAEELKPALRRSTVGLTVSDFCGLLERGLLIRQ